MDTQSYKSVFLNKATVNKEWVVIDATDLALGRLAARVALVLRGKTKAGFTPNVDCGDNVIVINAEKVALKGKKMTNKVYTRYTGYPVDSVLPQPRRFFAQDLPNWSGRLSKACFLRLVLVTSSSTTCSSMQVLSIRTRRSNQKKLS